MAEEAEVVSDKTLDQGLTETLRETLKGINERGDGLDTDTPVVAAETAAPAVEPKGDERPRDKDGKFAKGETVKESAAPAKADTPQKPVTAAAPAQAAAETPAEAPLTAPGGTAIDLTRAPSSWKPAAKAVWANLPQEVRAEIYRREGDFHVGNKPLKDNADFGQRMRQVIEPFRQMVEAEGGTPEKSIENYFRTAATLRQGTQEQKLQTLFALDKQFGAGMQQHFQQAVMNEVAKITGQPAQQLQQTQQQVYQDPRVDQLMQKFQREENERNGRDERARSQASEKFCAAKDEKGQPKYPFIDNVIDDMSARITGVRQANPELGHYEILEKAYDAAVWAHPETRAVLIGQQQAQAQQPVEKLQRVEKAKAASAGNMPKRGGLPATASVGKFNSPEGDAAMLDTLRQLTG